MTEQSLLPPPEEAPEATVAAPKPPPRDLVPWFYGLGFLILAAAIVYLWQYPGTSADNSGAVSALQTVDQRLTDMDARLNRFEQRPAVDLGKVTARIDALEARITDQTQLASRVDTLSGRIESLSGRNQTGIDATKQQIDTLTARVAALESSAGSLDGVTKRLNRIARLQQASIALSNGQPLGDLSGAPEALARYSHAAPPTEAALRLRFPHAEQAALAAAQPANGDAPFLGRVMERAQGLITIRRGDDVVVGDATAIALSHAQTALDVGDLAGAVDAVETLKGQPAQAMAPWVADAKALLDTRAALVQMADQA